MPGSGQSTSQWALKLLTKSISWRTRASGACGVRCEVVLLFYFFVFHFKFQQESCAMFPSDSDLTSLFQTLQCNTYHFEVGKNAKLCFPFICESLERVGVRAEWSHSLLLRPCGSPGSLHPALRLPRTREALRATVKLRSVTQCHLINLFSGVDFIPSVYVCKY